MFTARYDLGHKIRYSFVLKELTEESQYVNQTNTTNPVFISLELPRHGRADGDKTYVIYYSMSCHDRNQAVEPNEEEFKKSKQTPKLKRYSRFNDDRIVQFPLSFVVKFKPFFFFVVKSTLFTFVLVKMRARFW